MKYRLVVNIPLNLSNFHYGGAGSIIVITVVSGASAHSRISAHVHVLHFKGPL